MAVGDAAGIRAAERRPVLGGHDRGGRHDGDGEERPETEGQRESVAAKAGHRGNGAGTV
jgi:hypothetical protein